MPSAPQSPIRDARRRFYEAIETVRNSIEFYSQNGCNGFDCSEKSLRAIASWGGIKPLPVETLAEIREDLGECRRCRLCEQRTHIVFGGGNPRARLVFVGEAPGYDEDRQGEPFVGAAGQLLTRIIQAIQLTRSQVYICNVVKCRPPENRNPFPEEIRTCYPFLQRQLDALGPEFICALGSVAAQTLLQTDRSISKLRGRFYAYGKSKLIPTYHPAFLLRTPERKREVWEDMKRLMGEMAQRSGVGT